MLHTAVFCYALVMHREARGEPLTAQIATAKILENRSNRRGSHPCTELAKRKQFAFVRKYGIAYPNPVGAMDIKAWDQAQRHAQSIGKLKVQGMHKGYMYFNHQALGKRYKTKTQVIKIGQLLFY